MSWWRHGDPAWVESHRTHLETGATNHPLYSSYKGMVSRCYSDNDPKYSNYGMRGVRVADRWLEPLTKGFWNFIEDMGERPDGLTLDRIDVNGDYCPENCRWASQFQQQNNRSNNRRFVGIRQTPSGSWEAKLMARGRRYQKNFKTRGEAIAKRREWEGAHGY